MFAAVVIDLDRTAVSSAAIIAYGLLAAAGMAAGIYLNRPAGFRTWVAICSAVWLLVAGDVVARVISESIGAAIFIAAYGALGIGLASVSVARRPDHGSVVDALLISCAVASLDWELVTRGSHVSLAAANFQTVAMLVVFPALDAALITLVLMRVFRAGTQSTPASRLILSALAVTFLCQLLSDVAVVRRSDLGTALTTAGVTLGHGLFAACALHPSMRRVFAHRPARVDVDPVRLVLIVAAPLIPVVLLTRNIAVYGHPISIVLPALTAVCFVLSGIRIADLLNLLRHAAERDREASLTLREQNARLQELNEIKQSFMSMVSHELRTPLTSIVGYLEFLSEGEGGELSDEQAHFIEVIERNAGRLQQLVDEILMLGRADDRRIELNPGPVDIAELVRRSAESARPVAERKRLTLAVQLDSGLPEVKADEQLLSQALDNLISNAVKFTPTDGSVVIRARPDGEGVELTVQDTGVGIPADEVPRLFERFFRASTASVASGTGLGLPIVKAIAELHGGSITVDSVLGAGSTFRLRIPLVPVDAPRLAQTSETESRLDA